MINCVFSVATRLWQGKHVTVCCVPFPSQCYRHGPMFYSVDILAD